MFEFQFPLMKEIMFQTGFPETDISVSGRWFHKVSISRGSVSVSTDISRKSWQCDNKG